MINKLSVYIKHYFYSKENREPFFGFFGVSWRNRIDIYFFFNFKKPNVVQLKMAFYSYIDTLFFFWFTVPYIFSDTYTIAQPLGLQHNSVGFIFCGQ